MLKFLPASIYDAAAVETWLSDQAERGWLLEGFGLLGVRMERGVPMSCQYRLEPVDGAALIRDPDLRDHYADAGWEFVCFTSGRAFRVWRSTRPDPAELHGEPEVEAWAYRRLSRALYRGCALTVLWALLALYVLVPRPTALMGALESLVYQVPGTQRLIGLLLCGWVLARCFGGVLAVYRLRRRLRLGIPVDHTKRPCAWQAWGRRAWLAALAVLLVLSVWWHPVQTLSIRADVPPVRLTAELGADGEGPGGFIVTQRNLLAKRAVWSMETPNGTMEGADMVTKYVSLRLPFLARPLLAELRSWWDPADTAELEDARFDELLYQRRGNWQYLAFRRGGQVLYVAARAPGDLTNYVNDYAKDLLEAE